MDELKEERFQKERNTFCVHVCIYLRGGVRYDFKIPARTKTPSNSMANELLQDSNVANF